MKPPFNIRPLEKFLLRKKGYEFLVINTNGLCVGVVQVCLNCDATYFFGCNYSTGDSENNDKFNMTNKKCSLYNNSAEFKDIAHKCSKVYSHSVTTLNHFD